MMVRGIPFSGWSSPDNSRVGCCDRGYGRPSGRPRALDFGLRNADCGFWNENRGCIIDELLSVFSMILFDSSNKFSECIRYKSSMCVYKSEIRDPKS